MTSGPRRELSLLDSTLLLVGVIVGVGIYETSPLVAGCVPDGARLLGLWGAGGLLALSGALCYAELASAFPAAGGDYVYLRRAYGPGAGYLFGWSQSFIVRPADIALLSFVFGRYAQALWSPVPESRRLYAALGIAVLTGLNLLGLRQGKWTQNLLTTAKIAGLVLIAVAAFLAPGGPPPRGAPPGRPDYALALILILFTYGGWNEMGYVAAEVRDPHRNVVRALVIGTAAVTVLYLGVNAAFLSALGLEGMAGSKAVAVDATAGRLPGAARAVALIICLSALGAMNGLILTGARISYAWGSDHPPFRFLGRWQAGRGTPGWALVVQGAIGVALVLTLGSFVETLVYTAPVVWVFFLATAFSVFVLRRREPGLPRPYRVAGYPVTAAFYCLACGLMVWASVSYAVSNRLPGPLIAAAFLALGGILYLATRSRKTG